MKKPTLTIMCGIPRSGKSTWILKNKEPTDVIVCPDEIRKEIFGHQFFKPAELFIWAMTEAFIILLMKQKKDIIMDATNITPYVRSKNLPLVEKYGYKTKLVWINTDIDECLKRNKLSEKNKVPMEAMEGMCGMFQEVDPKYETDFDEIIEVKDGKEIRMK